MVPLLIEAIKELGEENQELQARLEALETYQRTAAGP